MDYNDSTELFFHYGNFRRKPLVLSDIRYMYRWVLAIQTVGLLMTLLFLLFTDKWMSGHTVSIQNVAFALFTISPYLGIIILSWWFIGSGRWRASMLLLGNMIIAIVTCFQIFNYCLSISGPVIAGDMTGFSLSQWVMIAVMLVFMIAPDFIKLKKF